MNINNGGRTTCSKSKVVSDKLEALKSIIPACTEETVKPDQLFQETADYIVLLKTQVVILQRLLQFYGSSTDSDRDNVVSQFTFFVNGNQKKKKRKREESILVLLDFARSVCVGEKVEEADRAVNAWNSNFIETSQILRFKLLQSSLTLSLSSWHPNVLFFFSVFG